MVVDARAKLDFLDLDDLLLLTGLGRLLLLKKAELAVIEDLADRRVRGRDDLHEIKSGVLSQLQSVGELDDALVLPLLIDQLHFAHADLFVYPGPVLLRGGRGFHWTANGVISSSE